MSDVRPPRVLRIKRRVPGRISLGDAATLEDGPELLQRLLRPEPGQVFPLGRGIHPMTTVPLGLAIEAAIAAINGTALDVGVLRYCSCSMEHFTSNRRPLRAVARVAELGARHVECAVEVWERERRICTARIGLCQVRGGRAAPLTPLYVEAGG